MLNFVTGEKGEASAVLIRALKPLNFNKKCSGPGLLTECLQIDKSFNGKNIFNNKKFWIEKDNENGKIKIFRSFRIGVKNDLKSKMRFFVEENSHIFK